MTAIVRIALWLAYLAAASWLTGIPFSPKVWVAFVLFLLWDAFIDGFCGEMDRRIWRR